MKLVVGFPDASTSLEYAVKNTFVHVNKAGRTDEVQPCTAMRQPYSDLTQNRDLTSLEYVQGFLVDTDKEQCNDIPLQPSIVGEGLVLPAAQDAPAPGPQTPRVFVDCAQERPSPQSKTVGESAPGPHTPRIVGKGQPANGARTPGLKADHMKKFVSVSAMSSDPQFLQRHIPESTSRHKLQREVPEQQTSSHDPPPPIFNGAFGLKNVVQDGKFATAKGTPSGMSMGAVGHMSGTCKPCAWYWKPESCSKGYMCEYCHLCDEGVFEKISQQRKKVKRSKPKTSWTTNGKDIPILTPRAHSSGEPFGGSRPACYPSAR